MIGVGYFMIWVYINNWIMMIKYVLFIFNICEVFIGFFFDKVV